MQGRRAQGGLAHVVSPKDGAGGSIAHGAPWLRCRRMAGFPGVGAWPVFRHRSYPGWL